MVLQSVSAPLELRDIQIPPLRVGQALVRIAFSGVCHSQVFEARGARGVDQWLPHLLGHEGSGVVVDVHPTVKKVDVGDSVILTWIKCDGHDAGGTTYETPQGPVNGGPVTTLSDYAVVSENRLVLMPSGVPGDVAVLFGCALPTGGGIVLNELAAAPGSTVGIFGLGGVGLCALMVAVASGRFSEIVAVDLSNEKLRLAAELGATATVDGRDDPAAQILELTSGRGLDFSVESSGRVSVIEDAFSSTRHHGGLCVFASHPPAGDRVSLDPFDLINGKQIRGSWGGGCRPDRDVPIFAEMYRSGSLPLERILSARYSLDGANEALESIEKGDAMRPLIEIDSSIP